MVRHIDPPTPPRGTDDARGADNLLDSGIFSELLGVYLRMVAKELGHASDTLLASTPLGAGAGRSSTLFMIAERPGISQMEIADAFCNDRSATFRIVQSMEKQGLLRREVDQNEKRRQNLYLTEDGEQVANELRHAMSEQEQRFFQALQPDERAELRRLLGKLWNTGVKPSL